MTNVIEAQEVFQSCLEVGIIVGKDVDARNDNDADN
jgi:hypothetical protein